jgi:hypothetical protein
LRNHSATWPHFQKLIQNQSLVAVSPLLFKPPNPPIVPTNAG